MTINLILDMAKMVIKENIANATCGIFHTRNTCGDPMEPLFLGVYIDKGVRIDICRGYAYFEVFGLSEEDFAELEKFYEDVRDEYRARLYAEWQSDDDEEDEDESGTEID